MRLERDHKEALFQIEGGVLSLVKTDVIDEVCAFDHLTSWFLAVSWYGITLLCEDRQSQYVLEATSTPPTG